MTVCHHPARSPKSAVCFNLLRVSYVLHGCWYAKLGAALLLVSLLGACSVNPALSWRKEASRLTLVALDAVKHPLTWGPIAGASALAATGWDERISDWAVNETPLFGGTEKAADASDRLLNAATVSMLSSGVLLPNQGRYDTFPGRRVAANLLAFGASNGIVEQLKPIVGRERPNSLGNTSFPSGHAVAAMTSAILIEKNLEDGRIPLPERIVGSVAAYGVAAATSWARIEGEKHYPVDVLASTAIANFVARFFYAALIPSADETVLPVTLHADGDLATVTFRWVF